MKIQKNDNSLENVNIQKQRHLTNSEKPLKITPKKTLKIWKTLICKNTGHLENSEKLYTSGRTLKISENVHIQKNCDI